MTADNSRTPNSQFDGASADELVDFSDSAIATLENEPETEEPAVKSPPQQARPSFPDRCPNCGSREAWGTASWCPSCGFYLRLGKCVDAKSPVYGQEQEIINFWEVVPVWSWILGIGTIAILVTSFVANAYLPETGTARLCWTLAQFSSGLAALFIAHVSAFMHGVLESERLSPFDLFLKPVEVWKPAIRRLPRNPWRFWCLGWGAVAMVCAVTIIGGVRYSAIFDDWGVEKRAAPNIVQSIVKQAREEREGADSLEDAMNDFVGEVEEEEEQIEKAKPLEKLDCVIVGYTRSGDGSLGTLLVASVLNQKLKYVGRIFAKDVPEEIREDLMDRMPTLERKRPFVKCPYSGTWLQPVLMCRVAFKEWGFGKRMKSPELREMLADVQ